MSCVCHACVMRVSCECTACVLRVCCVCCVVYVGVACVSYQSDLAFQYIMFKWRSRHFPQHKINLNNKVNKEENKNKKDRHLTLPLPSSSYRYTTTRRTSLLVVLLLAAEVFTRSPTHSLPLHLQTTHSLHNNNKKKKEEMATTPKPTTTTTSGRKEEVMTTTTTTTTTPGITEAPKAEPTPEGVSDVDLTETNARYLAYLGRIRPVLIASTRYPSYHPFLPSLSPHLPYLFLPFPYLSSHPSPHLSLTPIRYLAFTSDVGEAFRPVAHPFLVRGAYAISWAYCIGDVAFEGYKESKRGGTTQGMSVGVRWWWW